MNIAICEDDPVHAQLLMRMIEHWQRTEAGQNEMVKTELFLSAEQLLCNMNDSNSFDLAFLDIGLKQMDGLELARCLRKENEQMMLVFTQYRRSVLANGVDVRLKELIQQTCEHLNVEIIEMEIMPDHVHLLMEVDPQFGIHKAVKQIKGYSSRILREEFPWLKSRLPSLWTNSYFVSTVGGAPLAVIKQYIENQKKV